MGAAVAQQHDQDAWLAQAGVVQQSLLQARARLQEAEVTGTAGAGAVNLRLSVSGELREIRLDPSATDDVAQLQRHILAAHAQAFDEARKLTQEMVGSLNEVVARLTQF
jgi:DNA-binding protein YbaB